MQVAHHAFPEWNVPRFATLDPDSAQPPERVEMGRVRRTRKASSPVMYFLQICGENVA